MIRNPIDLKVGDLIKEDDRLLLVTEIYVNVEAKGVNVFFHELQHEEEIFYPSDAEVETTVLFPEAKTIHIRNE